MTKTCRTCTDDGLQCMFRQRDFIQPCPHGTYMPSSGTGGLMCAACPAGQSCLRKASATNCVLPQYSLLGEIHCHYCPSGASCTTSSYTLCSQGQYSDYGVSTCTTCEAGYMCPDIFQTHQKCPPGYYQGSTGQLACSQCAVGYYSSGKFSLLINICNIGYGATACTQCPAGSYCPLPDKPPITCPFGTYSAAGSRICSRCTDGYLCEAGETTATPASKTCSNGYICNPGRALVGRHHNIPCPAGYFSSSSGETSKLNACQVCTAGSYCKEGSASATTCLAGYYCPSGTKYATEFPCPEGTYRSSTGATQLSD